MRLILPALAATALLTGGCGYIGAPLPPLANVPARVTGLAAAQRASRLVVQFTLPDKTTEGIAIRTPLKLDVRIGAAGGDWAGGAEPVAGAAVVNGTVRLEIPAAKWTGQEVAIGVRAIGANGKASAWSDLANLMVVPTPETPASLQAEATAAGVHLKWAGSGGTFRVFRKAGDEKSFSAAATVERLEWTDPDTEFGRRYVYQVERLVSAGGNREAESDFSGEVAIAPVDTFPPAVPTGLRASPAPSSVELSWERNTEPDLAGYRVYRAAPGGNFEKIAEVSQIPAYSDTGVERGKAYRYAVSAVDREGNESARSAVAEAAL